MSVPAALEIAIHALKHNANTAKYYAETQAPLMHEQCSRTQRASLWLPPHSNNSQRRIEERYGQQ
jgi:hypothetical protein